MNMGDIIGRNWPLEFDEFERDLEKELPLWSDPDAGAEAIKRWNALIRPMQNPADGSFDVLEAQHFALLFRVRMDYWQVSWGIPDAAIKREMESLVNPLKHPKKVFVPNGGVAAIRDLLWGEVEGWGAWHISGATQQPSIVHMWAFHVACARLGSLEILVPTRLDGPTGDPRIDAVVTLVTQKKKDESSVERGQRYAREMSIPCKLSNSLALKAATMGEVRYKETMQCVGRIYQTLAGKYGKGREADAEHDALFVAYNLFFQSPQEWLHLVPDVLAMAVDARARKAGKTVQ